MQFKSTQQDERCVAFTGGRILTMGSPEEVDSVIFQSGKIIKTGPSKILDEFIPEDIINLHGRTLVPGFIDAHLHLSFGCFLPEWADLNGCASKEEILARMKKYAETYPQKEWIVGFPWLNSLYDGTGLSRADLDAIFPDRSVVLIHTTFHSMLVNSQALKHAEITRESPDPRSGFIERDKNGELSGTLIESACIPLYIQILAFDSTTYADLIERSGRELHQFGITAIHDPGVTPDAESAYSQLNAEKRLPVSVLMMPHGMTLLDNQVGERLQGPISGEGDEWLRTGPVKVFGDGVLMESTAISVTINGEKIASGTYRNDFQDVLIDAVSHGFQVCVHCLGNLTVDASLDCFESARKHAPPGFVIRPRLEHLNILSQDQIDRLASLNGCACVQPQFLMRAGHLNKTRFEGTKWFAYADMRDAGVVLAAGSDYPGGFMDARDVIACCRMGATMNDGQGNTISPEQALPFEQWLWMYTAGSAYVGGQECERGMIQEGLVADFVILEGDLNPDNPPVVAETWIAGRRVYLRTRNENKTPVPGFDHE
ncbi:amidohydrolase [Methanosphaerula palustris]|uniref:Amidohydrolase 3 n=1 Tax=Methanosphaerula palustris (strain ATCC BAA-1556 / DSM 19958 / E1-9c) TaxID=521011 RepID=B8GJ06_METPE|nr:amidohydrolase [Methanosphaerula palustris]ACL15579.1 Amidohydrolase 3 [Methanosphaerula palustris E1-9c]